jgi:hypothetical protein
LSANSLAPPQAQFPFSLETHNAKKEMLRGGHAAQVSRDAQGHVAARSFLQNREPAASGLPRRNLAPGVLAHSLVPFRPPGAFRALGGIQPAIRPGRQIGAGPVAVLVGGGRIDNAGDMTAGATHEGS